MKKVIVILTLVAFVITFTGCATVFKGHVADVSANSDPEGAKVFVNGEYFGTTPLRMKLDVNESYTIEFKKEGYKPVIRHITNGVGVGWIVLDIICGLVPVVVDAVTGSWYRLDQRNVGVVLRKLLP